jgi:HlyD family secretion protein
MTMLPPNRSQRAIRWHLLAGGLATVALLGGLGAWARTTEIAGAVMATGVVVVDSNVKKVQHPTGGIVGELNVRDDDHVQEGEVVVRLDETQTKANLSVLTKGLDELYARRARLEAERNAEQALLFPQELLGRETSDPVVAHLLDGERKLFALRLQARKGQKAQLQERIAQLRQEAEGLDEQIAAKSQEVGLIEEELSGVLELWKKQLIQITRLTALKRDAARLRGERGQLMASKASTLGKITETELQVIQVDEQARSQVAEELSDVRAKISETNERKIAAEDQLNHIDIRAPQTGRVHQLAVHTVGGVIAPGETLMLIVPENDTLSIEAKVSPHEIDQVAPDQIARLKFSAFSQQTTPELTGKVSWLAADLSEDERAGTFHYRVRIALPPSEFARLEGLKVIPGMPVETFIETGTRTVLSYLLKPLTDHTARMFRDS